MGCGSHKTTPQVKVIRVALIGARGSGKSALISCFLMRKFALAYVPTSTANVGMKSFSFKDSATIVTLEVWELNEAKALSDTFNYVLITLDCTRATEELNSELQDFITRLGLQGQQGRLSVVLTKCDCVPEEKGKLLVAMQKTLGVPEGVNIYATSASDQAGIDYMFRDMAKTDNLPSLSRNTSVAALPST